MAAIQHSCDFAYQQNHCGAVPARNGERYAEPNAGFYLATPSRIASEILLEVKLHVCVCVCGWVGGWVGGCGCGCGCGCGGGCEWVWV